MLDFRVSTFLAVCHTMNFTKAAQKLGLTQPAVTQHIHYLEQYYGVKLFHYKKKTLTLTRQGQLLLEKLRAMDKDERILKNEVQQNPESHPLLSIGVTMTIGEYAIVSSLSAFIHSHPEMNMHIHYANTQELLQRLNDGDIFLALIEGYYPERNYGHRKYRTENFICVCHADHVFPNGEPTRLRDLLSERLLLREKGSGTRNILERNLAARGMSITDFPSFMEIENMHTVIHLLERDCGISFLYRIAAREGLENGILREISLSDFSMQHDFDFVWDKNSIYAERAERIAQELML